MVHTIISNTVTPQEAFPVNIIDTDPNQINIFDVIAEEEQLHVDTTNDLLIPEFNNVENTGSDFDIDKENEPVNEPVIFDFEEEEPVDTTPVPDAFYEDQEKEENVLSDAEEFFNFDNDILDLPEL
jgi:hypothetical protein